MKKIWFFLLMAIVLFVQVVPAEAEVPPAKIKVLTINVWSGLNYKGTWRFGDYETRSQREERYRTLLGQIRRLDPDVIFVQEANLASAYSARLARDLGFAKVHNVCIGGIKFGRFGIPRNCKEGNAVLSRQSLNLEKVQDWKLSGSFGLFGDALTIHFDEAVFAQLCRISIDSKPVYLINVHLHAVPDKDLKLEAAFRRYAEEHGIGQAETDQALAAWQKGIERQQHELGNLAKQLRRLPADIPVIMAGDFNIPAGSPRIRDFLETVRFSDSFDDTAGRESYSWNLDANPNIAPSACLADLQGKPLPAYDILTALNDRTPRRIDYVFLSPHFTQNPGSRGHIVLNDAEKGLLASDHFGVMAEVPLDGVLEKVPSASRIPERRHGKKSLEPMPILMYDTDIGVGYGAKLFLLNQLKQNESIDVTAFNSTKGERWYRLVFSIPDFELRQGKIYPLAFDLVIDYDRYIKNNFFGVGSGSQYSSRETYSREPLDVSLACSRGFSTRFVGQFGLRYKTVCNSDFEDSSALATLEPEINSGRASYASLFSGLRFDSRDSYINPSRGTVLLAEAEWAPATALGNVSFLRLSGWWQYYYTLFYPRTVLALRLGLQGLVGDGLPVQVLMRLGGSSSLRGSPQDRYLDRIAALGNAEIRFPLVWRLGGIIGLDAGRVAGELPQLARSGWAINPTVGLRFYMNTFVVRFDVGFGRESTGIYFNFGHLF